MESPPTCPNTGGQILTIEAESDRQSIIDMAVNRFARYHSPTRFRISKALYFWSIMVKKPVTYADDVLIAIRKIIRSVDLHSRNLLQEYGMTGPQLVLLTEVTKVEKCSVSELATRVSLSQGTVTSIIDRLEKRGYLVRERSTEDRRKVFAVATEKGLRVVASRPSLLQERFIERFDLLEDWEKTLILSSLNRVCSMMNIPDSMEDSAPLLTTGPLSASPEDTQAYLEEDAPEENNP